MGAFFHHICDVKVDYRFVNVRANYNVIAATTGVQRNKNIAKLQAGYLFPEVRQDFVNHPYFTR
jgi:hypothetical protein